MSVYVATVERWFLPTGDESTLITFLMPLLVRLVTHSGLALPSFSAFRAGKSESRIKVVFPAPEKPVTEVRRPTGISAWTFFKLKRLLTVKAIVPSLKRSSGLALFLTYNGASPVKYCPINEALVCSISFGVPCAII